MVAVIGRVIDDYGPALDGFETDAIEVEGEVFSDSSRQPVRRLYQLKRELRRMFVALDALQDPLDRLMRVFEDHLSREVLADLRENADQLARAVARARSLSDLLDSALTASLTQISVQQNNDMRKISAWVAMAAVPTMVAGIYGMNFDTMPELRSPAGYPIVLIGMGDHRRSDVPAVQTQRLALTGPLGSSRPRPLRWRRVQPPIVPPATVPASTGRV